MKKIIFILFSVFILFSCKDEVKKEVTSDTEKNIEEEQDYWVTNHCLRGRPTRTLDTSLVTNYEFIMKPDRAIEKAELANGNKLIVSNEGCEVFWISYTFFINNYDQNASKLDLVEYAFKEVKAIDKAPIDFGKALSMIKKIKEGGGNIKLGNEYFLKMERVSEMFEVEEIDLKKEYATVEFSFAIGKL